ncbi:MAG TPA: muconolactone Delta-isomerase family protein [Anaerolineaceae bacterium]|nr:muconolactone Delta-isomerase family protein [Anaerolineaceae bacterium]
MKLIALEHERPGLSAADFQPHLSAEARQAWALYRQGVIRELYFRADRHTAVLVLECSSAAEAQAALDTLPLVQAGLIEFELLPLEPYTGFSRLFVSS